MRYSSTQRGRCYSRPRKEVKSATCGLHSPTKYDYLLTSPPGDSYRDGLDYNRYIMDWVSRLMGKKAGGPR